MDRGLAGHPPATGGSATRRRADLGAGAALLGGSLLFFLPVLFGSVFFLSDFQLLFVPLRRVLGQALREGFPLFTTLVGNGQPLAANPFAQALYPPNLLFRLPLHPARLLTALVAGHVVFGALGAFRLLRLQGLSRESAASGGLLFGFCGVMASATSMVLLVTTAAWTPWLLGAQLGAMRARGRRRLSASLLFGATLVLAVLAGDPTLLASAALGVTLLPLLSPAGGWRERARRASAPLAGLLLAGLVTAPLLLAMRRFVAGTVRALPADSAAATYWSLHPLEALGLLLPHPLGDPMDLGEGHSLAYGLYAGFPPLFPGVYVGLLAASLAALGLRSRRARPAAVWLGIQVFLALGAYAPFGKTLLGLPGLSLTRYPVKWLLGGALPLAALAAFGVQRLTARVGSGEGARAFLRVSAPALLLALFVAAGAPLGLSRALAPALSLSSSERRGQPTGTPEELTPLLTRRLVASGLSGGAVVSLAALVALLMLRRRQDRRLPLVLTLLLGLDLLRENTRFAPTAPLAFYDREPEAAALVRRDLPKGARVYTETTERTLSVPLLPFPPDATPPEAARPPRDRLEAYTAACYGLVPALNWDVERLHVVAYEELVSLVASTAERERVQLLSAAGVTHVVSLVAHEHPSLVPLGELPSGARQPLHVYRNTAALPRIRLVRALVAYDGLAAAAEALRRGPDDLLAHATLVPRAALPPVLRATEAPIRRIELASPSDPRPQTLKVLVDRPALLVAEVDGPGGALVVAETLTPGWRALLDGRPSPLLPADVAFRGVPLPPGRHRVELRYEPFG